MRGLYRPEAYHGARARHGFFEGWYIKLVSADRAARWAVIPGIFRGFDAKDEAFVQVLDGVQGRSWFHSFPIDEFHASAREFDVRVGGNHFDSRGVTLDLPQLTGRIEYADAMDPWPIRWNSPGIMGWYGLMPFMQCYHGIVSFGHGLRGMLDIEGTATTFGGGRGYIEKDWGSAFPEGYVWMHSNHIEGHPDASLIASVAIIPWLGSAFRGFIVGLRHDGRLYRWATYNRSHEQRLHVDDHEVDWSLDGPDGSLHLRATRVRGGLLHAPARESMHRRVEETLDAVVSIRHMAPDGRLLLDSTAACAGMEVFGDVDRLLALRGRTRR